MPRGPIEIDLSGPNRNGNVFYLMSLAKQLAKQLKIEIDGADVLEGLGFVEERIDAGRWITEQMQSGDYENALQVFDRYFGEWVILYR